MMIPPFVWLLLLGSLWAVVPKAHAGYANVVPSQGFRGGAVGAPSNPLTYTRTAANAPWFSGTAAGQVTANVGGRAVTMPAQARMAANAGQFLAGAVRLNPAAWAITGVAGVLFPILWDEVAEKWQVREGGMGCRHGGSGRWYTCDHAGAQERYWYDNAAVLNSTYFYEPVSITHNPDGSTTVKFHIGRNWSSGGFREWWSRDQTYTGWPYEIPVTPRDATDADWDAVGSKPPCYGAYDTSPGDCWGDELPNQWPEVVDPAGVPVPVEVPKVNPNPAPSPNPNPGAVPAPMRAPTGDPVPIPGSDPAQWRQPVVDIIPSPTPAEPWRVDLQPKDVVLDDPADGLTEPEPLGSGDPAGTPSEQQQQLCEVYPDIVACMQAGEPEDVELDAEERDVSFTPASGFGAGNASCPADKQMVTSLAGTLSLSWGPACQFATGLRPVVIALAALSGALIFLGGFKGAD